MFQLLTFNKYIWNALTQENKTIKLRKYIHKVPHKRRARGFAICTAVIWKKSHLSI